MISNWLYRKYKDQIIKDHKEDLIKAYIDSIQPAFDLSQLDFRFLDSKGRKYYSYNDKLQMSNDRVEMMTYHFIWYSNGLTERHLDDLLDVGEEALSKGLANIEKNKMMNASIIGTVFNELRNRRNYVRPVELMLNMFVLNFIREDEDPKIYNEKIHLEKVSQLLEEINNGNSFFLQTKEWKTLFDYSIMSEEEWMRHLTTKQIEMEKAKKEIVYFLKSALAS